MGEYTTHILRRGGVLVAALFGAVTITVAQAPDMIITHARVYTVNPAQPWAEAVAIRDGKFIAVGSTQDIEKLRAPKTRILNAQRHIVLPGLTDSHIHFLEGSLALTKLQLEETKSVEQIQSALRKYARTHPPGTDPWIIGRGWTYAEFGAAGMPHKKFLDAVVPDRPVILEGFDGHTTWVNSKALALAKIEKHTPDPANGKIVRDEKGEATGALQEAAADLVTTIVPLPSHAERIAALRRGLRLANRSGLTRVIVCGNDTRGGSDSDFFALYSELLAKGELTLRFKISSYIAPGAPIEKIRGDVAMLRREFPESNGWIEAGAVKMFLDGVIEGHTAAMLEPYTDDPSHSGELRWNPEEYRNMVTAMDKDGIQVYTHAIGDRAVRLALDAYGEAAQANHTAGARHRIEHIETISAEDIPRFGSLGVVASYQPLHAYPDEDTLGPWLSHVGPERASRAWAWHDVAAHSGTLAFGSDWPVVTLNPWPGIQNAITRQTREGKPEGGWIPQQRITLEQAIYGYTMGAAIGGRREKWEGSIEPGKYADLVIVASDIFAMDPHRLASTEVLMTIVDGKTVYQSPRWANAKPKPSAKSSGKQ
ncbi:MAG: amidohydrolase [Acidobacteriales bacterium]|nr:amidohydrolase [Terriglobales bacterium]